MSAKLSAAVVILFLVVGSLLVAAQGRNYCASPNPFASSSFSGSSSLSTGSNVSLSLNGVSYILPTVLGSNVSRDLLDPSFWSLVGTGSAATFGALIPQTVSGFINSGHEWRDWILAHTSANPPTWITAGSLIPSTQEEIVQLEAEALSSNSSAGAAMAIQHFAASIGGYGLAALDYLSFGGLTALNTYLETGSVAQAICASFPGQLGQLYQQAFDSSVPRETRAQYLGEALAITSVIVVVGGIGGVLDKLPGAIDALGLGSVWETVKPYFSDLGAISPTAANLVLRLLQKLALKYPSQFDSEAGLVSFRIDSMAEVLHNSGDSTKDIDQKITGLVAAVDSSSSPDDIANQADEISYEDGGGIDVIVGSGNHLFRYSDASTRVYFDLAFLQDHVSGFVPHDATFLKVYYFQEGAFSYNYYSGGETWTATVPEEIAKPGDILTIHIQILTEPDFVASIPKLQFSNDAGYRWLTQSADIDSVVQAGNHVTLTGSESPSLEGTNTFSIRATTDGSLNFAPAQGPYLQLELADMFGQNRGMRIYYDGYGAASLRLESGGKYPPVSMISDDGVRLSIVYGNPRLAIATIYEASPAMLYNLGDMVPQPLDFEVQGATLTYQINRVTLVRQLETSMLDSSSNYAHGRLGAEIAYAVTTQKLGLSDVVLADPAQGGPDLYTQDGTVVVEARLLTVTQSAPQSEFNELVQAQLSQMVNRISKIDFTLTPSATTGYAILTYLDNSGGLHTMVLEVLKK